MPNTSSAKKQVRVNAKKQQRNKSVRSQLKTNITKTEKLISANDTESAQNAAVVAISSLDKASVKGIIHPNNGARRKSRLMKKLNKTQA